MDFLLIVIRQALLFLHLIAFAFAIVTVLKEDFSLLRASRIDPIALHATGKLTVMLLGLLWVTGLMLVGLDTGFNPTVLASKPKLATKLTVLLVLTINGVLLHWLAFPKLTEPQRSVRGAAIFCSVLGAISSVTWMFASFVGVARLIAPAMTYKGFLSLYGISVLAGLVVALVVVRPYVERLIPRVSENDTNRHDSDDVHAEGLKAA